MIQNINLGAAPNDKTGDKARVAGGKINGNFAYLEGLINNQTYLEAETGFTLVGQDLTINAFWQWVISGIDYTNPSDVLISIPVAAAGKLRIDLIVCNTSNTFSRVAGEESLATPNAPAVPLNTILATFFTVSDGSVGTVATPKPKAPVLSVNGKRGDVVLGIADIADYNEKFKGVYLTSAALNIAHPTAIAGDYAQVNETGSTDVVNYSWDAEESIWVNNGTGGSGATNTDALPEGSTNLYHTSARVLATLLTGISFVTGGAIVSTDSVLIAFGKLQKQISDLATLVSGKQDTLVSGTNIKTINSTSILGSGDIVIAGGGEVNYYIQLINARAGGITNWYYSTIGSGLLFNYSTANTSLATQLARQDMRSVFKAKVNSKVYGIKIHSDSTRPVTYTFGIIKGKKTNGSYFYQDLLLNGAIVCEIAITFTGTQQIKNNYTYTIGSGINDITIAPDEEVFCLAKQDLSVADYFPEVHLYIKEV